MARTSTDKGGKDRLSVTIPATLKVEVDAYYERSKSLNLSAAVSRLLNFALAYDNNPVSWAIQARILINACSLLRREIDLVELEDSLADDRFGRNWERMLTSFRSHIDVANAIKEMDLSEGLEARTTKAKRLLRRISDIPKAAKEGNDVAKDLSELSRYAKQLGDELQPIAHPESKYSEQINKS